MTQFFASLFGTTGKKAQSSAKALYEEANALKAAGSAAEDAAGSLAGFDEINTIQTENKSSGSGGADADTGPLFDWDYNDTPFDSWGKAFSAFLDKLLASITKLEESFKKFADWLNDLAKKLYDMFKYPGVYEKVKQLGRDLAGAFNKLVDWIDWEMLGRALGAGLIYRPTGQKIMFRGVDDPMKLKSIKVPFGYIAITHFEEKDQFTGREEITNILQSTMRGGSVFWNFESYNPPLSRDNWANLDSMKERADRLCHRSTYLDAPPKWLGEQFLIEAEHRRLTDERAYRHEYLGEAVGAGGNVFENLELWEITDREIASFDRIFQGVDWGWFPDPFAFVRLHYDRARETI